jgi:ribosome-binding ATPase YchF (GTP1/OBG family)
VLCAFGPDPNPAADLSELRAELALADLATVDKVSERVHKQARAGAKDAKFEAAVCERAELALSQGRWLSEEAWTPEELRTVHLWTPLTIKPVFHVINTEDLGADAEEVPDQRVVVRGKLEAEAAELPEEEADALLGEFGVTEPALMRFARCAYDTMTLVTFFTANSHEAHAWAVPAGTNARQAAGGVHSDFEHKFIRAERVAFDELAQAGSPEAAKEQGLVRVEGKDYEVREGDIIFIRHS